MGPSVFVAFNEYWLLMDLSEPYLEDTSRVEGWEVE